MKTTLTFFLMLFLLTGLEQTMAQKVQLGSARDYSILEGHDTTMARIDMEAAYMDAAEREADYIDLYSGIIGGKSLKPGVYEWNTDVVINADIFLEGGPDAYWIFNINGSLTLESGVQMIFENCAQPDYVFWRVSENVHIGTNAYLVGTVLAQGEVILESGASVNGRILSQKSVSLDQNEVSLNAFTELTFTKTADTLTYYYVGQEIWYTIYLYNSGTNAILDMTVEDPLLGFEAFISRLNPCHPRTFHVKYIITQEDLDNGFVLNTVTAIGVDEELEAVEESTEEMITAITNAELSLLKTADKDTVSLLNETITYTITVANLGNITLYDVIIDDPKTGFQETIPKMSPGDEETFTVNYQVTQEDLNAGSILNLATVTGRGPQDQPAEAEDEVLIIAVQDARITLDKTADTETYEIPGEVITYTIEIGNTGNVTLSEVLIEDPLTGMSETIANLNPGISQTFTTTFTITQEDIDTGSVSNTATVRAKDPKGEDVTASDAVNISANQYAQMSLQKLASPKTYAMPGEVITYTIKVSNNGNVTLSDLNIEDPLIGMSETITSLSPGVSQTHTATYTITQEDIDTGSVMNAATVDAMDPKGDELTASDEVSIDAIQNPQISLQKTTDTETYEIIGEVITYTIEVSNTGNVTLSEVFIEDPLTGMTESIPSLSPGVSQTISTTYTISQKDLDAGGVTNAATVIAQDPNGDEVTASDEATITAIQLPQISLQKTTDTETYEIIGEVITYTIEVSNTGNVTLSEVFIEDPLTGMTESIPSLNPGVSQTISTTYTISQEDLDTGGLTNAATVIAQDPNGDELTASDEVNITAIQSPQISLQKTADPNTYDGAGVQITYTIAIKNTGNVTVADINIEDDLTGDSWEIASLAAGEEQVFTAQYITTQQDFDQGSIMNTASAIGKDPQGNDVTASDEELVTSTPGMAALSVTKTADRQTYENPGDIITYTITVSNTGDLTITDISIVDDLTANSWNLETLSPGDSESFIATYTINGNDIDVGSVTNTVVATGKDPQDQILEDNDQQLVTAIRNPMLSISKSASPSTYSQIGTQINYVIIVENTGNVTISDMVVEDDLTGNTWEITSLGPGEEQIFNTSYTITQDDLDSGSVLNTATVTGKDPDGNDIADSDDETVNAINNIPAISISKSSSRPVYASVGDAILYEIVVTNNGNTSLFNVDIEDNLTGETWAIALLSPGESQTFNTSYTVSQYDIDNGHVHNIATVYADDFQGNTVSDSDEENAIAIKVPGGLTPDTEYDNILIIEGLEYYPRNTFRIFNRYGTLVFEASPYQNDWVGVPNRGLILTEADGKVPSGTYFYMLVLEPNQEPFSGYIYLIKN